MSNIDFQGVSGGINFDKETGFNTARQVNIYQFEQRIKFTQIGFYTSKEHIVLFNESTLSKFIMPTLAEKRIQVSVAVAVFFSHNTICRTSSNFSNSSHQHPLSQSFVYQGH